MFYTYDISDFFQHTIKNRHFHINPLEKMPPLPENIVRPHKHRFYEMFYVKNGQLMQNVDYKAYTIDKNQLFFISQGQLHIWHERVQPIKGFRLMFTEDFFQVNQLNNTFLYELIYLDNVYAQPFLQLPETTQLDTLFDLLLTEYERDDCKNQLLQAILFLILNEVQRLYQPQKSKYIEKHEILILKKFLGLVEQHYRHNWAVADYAQQVHLSLKTLNRITQNAVNQSISTIVANRKILEAKRLLTHSDLTLAQIADQLGFEDLSYFIRIFRKATAQTPHQFRQNK
jgi:AraC family transcriptional regulator, transcriptional activator of pobA